MSDAFSFKPTAYYGNYGAQFLAIDGGEFTLKCRYSSDGSCHEAKLHIQWKKMSSKFIRVTCYADSGRNLSETTLCVTDQLCASISLKYVKSSVLVVHIYPKLCLDKLTNELTLPQALPSNENKSVVKSQTVLKKLEQLSTDMRDALDSGKHSDVTLTDGSNEIRAHKLVLCARSKVFDKMLEHPMKENIESRITIKDISMEVLRELLGFMYTGTVAIRTWEETRALYVAADKHDVKDLKDICSEMLMTVDLNNVLETLLLAELYSDRTLREASMNIFEIELATEVE